MTNKDSLAAAYVRWRASRLGRITDAIEQRELLRRSFPLAGKQVLDVGCGDGFFTIAIAKAGGVVIGVDTDDEMLSAAKANASSEGVSVDFKRADACALPFHDATFDVVVAASLLCLVRDRDAVLAEMARVLKPNGRLVIGELGAWSVWNTLRRIRGVMGARPWRDAHFFTPGEMRRMMGRAGLRATSVTGAVYYPPLVFLADLISSLDSSFAKLGTFGAAFLVAAGERPA
ncbi:MAG: class I SAM-dependent methyltransferase [Pseudomonadota bacterium]